MTGKKTVSLSLISHTNIGKTTLARTLLRREVGAVHDEAHVTDQSTPYTMLETPDEALILWDTPGFGNVSKLIRRLEQEKGAWGWIVHEVVDRVFNRSLFCSLEAARHVRNQAEVILYLVNVREKPEDAGYVPNELKLLNLVGKPVIMILNQIDAEQLADAGQRLALEKLWFEHFSAFPCLKAVMVLDAFTRTWHQELRLIEALKPWVSDDSRASLERLARFHSEQQFAIFNRCAAFAADLLWQAKLQRMEPGSEQNPKALFEKLVAELQHNLDTYLDLLVDSHGIQAEGQAHFKADLEQVTGQTASKLDEKKSGLLAGALSSASTGLMADILSGGLTFGGGAILGFLGGYVGGRSYAKMMNLRKRGAMAWRHETLLELFHLLLVYFLVAMHHGRGRGKLNLEQPLDFIAETSADIWVECRTDLKAILEDRHHQDDDPASQALFIQETTNFFRECIQRIIRKLYPESPSLT